ncbi:unknown [Pasteurella phage F108]|uniref:Capsid protein n=1 Tax=Pasteurella phage F108 TaxID=2911430 RepID=Q1I0Z9_9CAUD|nr:major head protein [Pasteurella phage F108]AAZ93656.1 unknown [Pasteurella phage F108]
MNKTAQELFYSLIGDAAEYYGANPALALAGKQFSIEAPKESVLLGAIQQRSNFLEKINCVFSERYQRAIDLRSNRKRHYGAHDRRTPIQQRWTRQVMSMNVSRQIQACLIPWAKLDQWGHLKDKFASLYAEFVQNQIALDMIKIGFYGTSVGTDTSDPNLADVNKGWIQFVRENKATQILTQGATSGEIRLFGEGADYVNLDELAYDLKQGLDARHRDAGDLVFLVGADLVAKEASLVYKGNGLIATEKAALNTHDLMKSFGGMPAMIVPNMPPRAAIVTSLSNLSIYTQEGSMRRGMKDDDDKKAVRDSYYRNEAYAVEDCGKFMAVDFTKVKLSSGKGTWK